MKSLILFLFAITLNISYATNKNLNIEKKYVNDELCVAELKQSIEKILRNYNVNYSVTNSDLNIIINEKAILFPFNNSLDADGGKEFVFVLRTESKPKLVLIKYRIGFKTKVNNTKKGIKSEELKKCILSLW